MLSEIMSNRWKQWFHCDFNNITVSTILSKINVLLTAISLGPKQFSMANLDTSVFLDSVEWDCQTNKKSDL